MGDWQDAKYHQKEFDEIFTVAKDSPFVGNHFYGLVDGPYPDNEILLPNAIDDLLNVRKKDWQLGKRILVHCVGGFSRSVTVVSGYIIAEGYEHDVEDAIYRIRKIRPLANPNPEFVRLLKNMI